MVNKKKFREKLRKAEITTEEGEQFLEKYDNPTKKQYRKRLHYYLAWSGLTCKELIDEAEEDWKKDKRGRDFLSEEQANQFRKDMNKIDYSSNTIANVLSTVKAFYKFHQFPLNQDRIKKVERINQNHHKRIEKDDLRKLYNSTTSKRNKAILLFLYQTGQAVKQVSDLDYSDVKEELENGKEPLMIEYSGRKGHGNNYVTFLGSDGVHALKEYLEDREKKLGRKLEGDDPLFSLTKNLEKRAKRAHFSEMLKYLAKKADLTTEEELKDKRNPYSPHAFRKNFKSQLTTKCSDFVVEFMLGHEIGVEKDYFLADFDGKEGLRKYYAKNIEPELSIQTTSTEKEAIISDKVEIAKEEKLQEIASQEMREETERWRKKWTEERMERKALEKTVEEQNKRIEELSGSLTTTQKALFDNPDIDFSKEEVYKGEGEIPGLEEED